MKINISPEEKNLSLVVAILLVAQLAMFGIEYGIPTSHQVEAGSQMLAETSLLESDQIMLNSL